MNFKLSKVNFLYLTLITLSIGVMQVATPLFLRTLIDGIIPSKDGRAIATILTILGMNELLLIISNGVLNRQLDKIEKFYLELNRDWMLGEVTKNNHTAQDPDQFFQAWTNHVKQLVYKKIKNPWFRIKDFVVLSLLTFICLNISYLAGGLILLIAVISLITVKSLQENQGTAGRQIFQSSREEKILFNDVITSSSPNKLEKMAALKKVASEINDLQYQLSKERSSYQDINSLIRFTIMFSILSVGGYLFATEKLTMGSLWALLITMYRITPSLQSIVRWFLQLKGDENLEDRVWSSLKTTSLFKKPEFYNRMVKLIEKHFESPTNKWIKVNNRISSDDLIKSLELWKSFYSQKENIEIVTTPPDEWSPSKLYMFVGDYKEGEIRPNIMVFYSEKGEPLPGFEIQNLA